MCDHRPGGTTRIFGSRGPERGGRLQLPYTGGLGRISGMDGIFRGWVFRAELARHFFLPSVIMEKLFPEHGSKGKSWFGLVGNHA